MKMNIQIPTLAMLVVALFVRMAAGAATLDVKHSHHHKQPVDLPGDGSPDSDTNPDDSMPMEDPEMPSGDSASLEADAEAAESADDEAVPEAAMPEDVPAPVKLAQKHHVAPRAAPQHAPAKVQKAAPKPVVAPKHAPAPKHVQQAVPKQVLRAAVKAVKEHAPVRALSGETTAALKKEHILRVSAEHLVKKLTNVLNHTTDALKKKDEEVDMEIRSETVLEAKLKKAQQENQREKVLLKQRTIADALDARQGVSSSLKAQRKAQQAQQLIADAKKAANGERQARLSAEKKVSDMAGRLKKMQATQQRQQAKENSKRGMDPLKLMSDLNHLKGENKKLVAANAKAQSDVEKLTDNVDEAEAARKAKTEDAKKAKTLIEHMKVQEQDDLKALEKVKDIDREALKKQLKQEEAKQKAAFESEQQKAEHSIGKLTKQVQQLNATDEKLDKEVAKEKQQTKTEQTRAVQAEAKIVSEHKAFLQARTEIANDKKELASDKTKMQQLQKEADEMHKAQKTIKNIQAEFTALNQTNAEHTAALETALNKLDATDKTLDAFRKKLKEATGELKKESASEKKANGRVHQLWQTLKQKKAQLEIHDQELVSVKQELSSTAEEKNVLAKELKVTESKLAKNALSKKEIEAAHKALAKINTQLSFKDDQMAAMRKQVQAADAKVQDLSTVKAKLLEAAAEQKELVDQLAAARQQEKDRVAAAAAKDQEMNARLQAGYKREEDLKAKSEKQKAEIQKKDKDVHAAWEEEAKIKANRLADALNAEQAVQQQDSVGAVADSTDEEFLLSGAATKLQASLLLKNVTKAALLTGKSKLNVLRTSKLQLELATKTKELKTALAQVHDMQAEDSTKDMELEEARQALLHAAAVQLPTATAQEAAAARAALEKINSKFDAQELELNASKAELSATLHQDGIENQEVQLLKTEHVSMLAKIKKEGVALTAEYKAKAQVSKEFMEFKANLTRVEKAKQDAIRHKAEMEKAAKLAQEKAQKEAAAKAAAAAKQAALNEQKAEKAAAEKAAQEAKLQQQQPAPSNKAGSDDDDDDDDADSDSDSNSGFAATVPWDSISSKMAKISKQ